MSATPVQPVGFPSAGRNNSAWAPGGDPPIASWRGAGTVATQRERSVALRIRRLRLLGLGLIVAGCLVVPWIGLLAANIPALAEPSTWNDAWIGLDTLEAAGLLSTGLLLRRQDPRMRVVAAATATLLYMDAWFDVMTATPAERPLSIVMALVAELPVGTLCAVLALRNVPKCRGGLMPRERGTCLT